MSEHWRSSLFNEIINKLNYTSYLELGVSTGEYCWNSVICEKKVGVDSNPQTIKDGVVCALTYDFFSKLSKDEKFHLIFIHLNGKIDGEMVLYLLKYMETIKLYIQKIFLIKLNALY